MKSLSVVLCTYNEEKSISKTLSKLLKYKIIKEIIIIDDNSQDNTIRLIRQIKNKKVKLYVRKKIRGFASALIKGIGKTNYNYILRFDVDMHSNIEFFIKSFLSHGDKDCIIFSRYVRGGKDLRGNFRKYSSLFLNKICNYFLSKKVKDYTSCIMIINKKILKDISIKNTLYANFIIKFIYTVICKKIKFIEIPFIQKKNTELNSKSAPNIKIFIKNGMLYCYTIIECLFLKLKS